MTKTKKTLILILVLPTKQLRKLSFFTPMRSLLKQYFGYDEFRPLQEAIIQTVLDRKDVLVLMPTGGGKSLCYQLPALMFDGLTLVISPLVALMKDQVDGLEANGIASAFLNSTLTAEQRRLVEQRALNGEYKLLYIAPERLSSIGFESLLRTMPVRMIAIDEAHCISEWGHDFRPEYRNLKALRKAFPSVPVIALTATATQRVRDDILRELSMPTAQTFLSSFNRPNLHYSVRQKFKAFDGLVDLLRTHTDESVIIYCFSRKDTEELARDLRDAGFLAQAYHAGLEKEQRKRVQDQFIHDEIPIIVATIAFGMGIDKPDVRLVVHMDFPKTIESYYQETGRAGRDGLPSACVLFFSLADKRKQDYFINQIENEVERANAKRKCAQVIDYGQLQTCRRAFLLRYFGETVERERCEACDNCSQEPTATQDATEISQKILSTVLRTGEFFGSAYICDVLRGSRRKQIVDNRHDQLSVHGIASNTSAEELRTRIDQLLREGYLAKTPGDYPVLVVSQKGKESLRDRSTILLGEIATTSSTTKKSQRARDSASDDPLFEHLRALRKQLADAQGVPAYIIFGNRTLQDMCARKPKTRDELAEVFGVGEKKLEQFGETFLEAIRQYTGT